MINQSSFNETPRVAAPNEPHLACVLLLDTSGSMSGEPINSLNRAINDFLNMTSITDAALAFAKCYERCASGSYTVRQNNAITAYNYFVS